jgi:ferric-dicitrate binding protein FerR (iron transport regulator)
LCRTGAWRPAAQYDTLRVGDELRTGPSQALSLWFSDGTRLQIAPNTHAALLPPGPNETRPAVVDLHEGSLSVVVAKAQSRVGVRTVAATATATGTRFGLGVNAAGRAELSVYTGSVTFSNEAGSVTASGAVRTSASAGSASTNSCRASSGGVV